MDKTIRKNYMEPMMELVDLYTGDVITSSIDNPYETDDDILEI